MEDEALAVRVRILEKNRERARRAHAIPLAILAGFVFAFAAPAAAQTPKKRSNDPTSCPYCHNDPALMKAAGIVSHGGFDFGKTNTEKVDELLLTSDIRWIETPNFKIGLGLGPMKVKLEEKKKILAELTRLSQALPEIKPDTAILDSWLRAHLYAQRTEDLHWHFLQIMQAEDAKFANGSGVWSGPYQGEGPYLGMRQKYEVLFLSTEAAHVTFLTEHCGLHIKNSQRWHYTDRGAITLVAHAQQGNLRQDAALHGHLAFNLAHNLYDGFYHYSYDTPVWYHEGLAHFMEREIDPDHNSFDSGEGGTADMTSKSNWKPEVLKLITSGEAPRLAELMQLKSYAELKLPHHYVTWSMVEYLIKTNPTGFANFLKAMKLCLNEKGVPTGGKLLEFHRDKFKECLGMNYNEFDEAWRAWALIAYKPGIPKGSDPNASSGFPPGKGIPGGGGGDAGDGKGGG